MTDVLQRIKTMFKELLDRISRPIDLTKGTPWKVLLKYGAPIILSYLLQQVYVLTDAIICGQVLSAGEVAGVNDTFALTFLFLQFAFGCTAGFGVLTAKYVGEKNNERLKSSLSAQIVLTAAISVVLSLIAVLLLPLLLKMINVTPVNEEVYGAAYDYCLVIFIGIFTQMGYNFACGVLRAYGDSLTPLIFLIASTVLNVGLDVLFLTVFKMGVTGAALATVITQFLSMIGCFAYTFARYKEIRLKLSDFKKGVKDYIPNLKQGLPLGLQFSVLAIGIVIMQGVVVNFDVDANGIMAANTPAQNGYGAGSKLFNVLASFYNGLGSAILVFVAQNYGKGDYDNIRKGCLQALIMVVVIHAVCFLIACLCCINGAYQYLFMSADKVSAESIKYGNVFIFVDVANFTILGFLLVVRSAAQGICKSGYVLGAGIMELIARSLICLFLPPLINGGAITSSASIGSYFATCYGDPGAWLFASTLLLIPFIRYILKKKYKKEAIK